MKSIAFHTTAIPLGSSELTTKAETKPLDVSVWLPGFNELPVEVISQDALLVPDRMPVTPTRRLVILVPPGETDERALVYRVWQLASHSHLSVLYLGLEPDDLYVSYQRRRLSGMASLTSHKQVRAKATVNNCISWIEALESILHPGDMLVCLSGHQMIDRFIRRRILGEVLVESMSLPVYMIGGMKIGLSLHQRQQIKEFQAWTASTVLIVSFFGMQIEIDRSMAGSGSTLLLILSVLVEFLSLWKINQWIR